MTEYIEMARRLVEFEIFAIAWTLRQNYEPWWSLIALGILALLAAGLLATILLWIFNRKVRWYHKLIYVLPVIKTLGVNMFRKGHRTGAIWGYEEGRKATGNPKKFKQRKISRALERAGL